MPRLQTSRRHRHHHHLELPRQPLQQKQRVLLSALQASPCALEIRRRRSLPLYLKGGEEGQDKPRARRFVSSDAALPK